MAGGTVRRYDQAGRLTRSAYVVCWLVLLAAGAGLVVLAPSYDQWSVRLVGVAAMVAGGFLVARLLRWRTIDVTGRRVVFRGLLRTTKIGLDDLDRFGVVSALATPSSRTKVLTARTRDGKTIEFEDFSSDDRDGASIEDLVDRLNRNVSELVGASVRVGAA